MDGVEEKLHLEDPEDCCWAVFPLGKGSENWDSWKEGTLIHSDKLQLFNAVLCMFIWNQIPLRSGK